MKSLRKTVIAGVVLGSVFITGAFAGGTVISATLRPDIKVIIDGSQQSFKDANGNVVYPVSYNDTTYLPIRAIGGIMGKSVGWDEATQTITLSGENETPTDTTTYSRENPAKVGVTQTVNIDDGFDKYTADVTFTELYRGDEAWQLLKQQPLNVDAQPQNGREYALVKVKAKVSNLADGTAVSLSRLSFKAFNGNNASDNTNIILSMPGKLFQGEVYNEGTLEGYAVFLVDAGDAGAKVVFGVDSDGTGGIWFSLSK